MNTVKTMKTQPMNPKQQSYSLPSFNVALPCGSASPLHGAASYRGRTPGT